jgi:hypothetical protein
VRIDEMGEPIPISDRVKDKYKERAIKEPYMDNKDLEGTDLQWTNSKRR